MGGQGLRVLYKKIFVSTVIFLLILITYIIELYLFNDKIADLKTEYLQKIRSSEAISESLSRKREIDNFEKQLESNLNLSLAESVEVLQRQLPYVSKEKIKEVLENSWSIEWQQASLGKPPTAVVMLSLDELTDFLQFLQKQKLDAEISEFNLQSEGDQLKITLIFAK